jgi:hypothetical protein
MIAPFRNSYCRTLNRIPVHAEVDAEHIATDGQRKSIGIPARRSQAKQAMPSR